jgi:hypothetical protein
MPPPFQYLFEQGLAAFFEKSANHFSSELLHAIFKTYGMEYSVLISGTVGEHAIESE